MATVRHDGDGDGSRGSARLKAPDDGLLGQGTTLRGELVDRLRQFIVEGSLTDGGRLPSERELASTLAVSRSSLREALRALEIMGYVDIKDRQGIYIRHLGQPNLKVRELLERNLAGIPDLVVELFEVRKNLEGWGAYLAAERANAEDLSQIAEALEVARADLGSGARTAGHCARFHELVIEASHNRALMYLHKTLSELIYDSVSLVRRSMFGDPSSRRKMYENHKPIFEAITDGDAQRAEQLMRADLDAVLMELAERHGAATPAPR